MDMDLELAETSEAQPPDEPAPPAAAMTLELDLPADAASRLTRLPAVARMKTGRSRTRKVTIVWHDSPARDLSAGGLALAEQHGAWRLERIRPGPEPWPPGAPPPALAESTSLPGLGQPLPQPLLPAVAFEGRALDLSLAADEGPVLLTLLRGTLRTIGREQPACRLFLSGAEPAVLLLALALAGESGASVTRASLAAEALAMAIGALPSVRRHGAPTISEAASVADAFGEAVGHLADVILQLAPAAAEGTNGPDTVHHMRVAVRRLRSALAVFRRAVACPAVEAAEAGLKALGARLGPTRDWDVFATETGPRAAAAFPGDKRLERLLAVTERRRRAHQAALGAFLRGPEFRRLGVMLAWIAAGRSWHDSIGEAEREVLAAPLTEFAARVLSRRLKRVAAAGEGLDGLAPELLHDVRLLAKRLRYAAEIFAPLWPGKATRRFLERLAALQQVLGMLNDGAVAAGLLDELAAAGGRQAFAAGLVLGFVGAGAGAHRTNIARAWTKFRRQEPFWT